MSKSAALLLRLPGVLLCLIAVSGAARAAEPFARAEVATEGTLYVGQQIDIDVDVFVPNFFMSSPQFPLFNLPNAVVLLPDTGALNLAETQGTDSFAGIRRTYRVTAQAPGDFTLPAVAITFRYAAVPGQATEGSVAMPQVAFTVLPVPGGGQSGGQMAAASVTISQSTGSPAESVRVGDTLVRTILIEAQGLSAMAIPEPEFSAPEGVRIYRHDPKLEDRPGSRGVEPGATRTDTVTYRFDRPGHFTLPAVNVPWFDPQSGSTEEASVPAIVVVVQEAAAGEGIAPPAQEEPSARSPVDWRRLLPVAIAIVAVLLLGGFIAAGLPLLLARWRRRRVERQESEAAYFGRLRQACSTGDRKAAAIALDRWARRAGIRSVSNWLDAYGDADGREALDAFQAELFSSQQDTPHANLARLMTVLARARKKALERASPTDTRAGDLPELNAWLRPSTPTAEAVNPSELSSDVVPNRR
ncbi:BatD family protein [Rhizobium sp. BK251]|uniref:BatD family protein n=1 Tax=Rhizobium sp. BK251 TaxID=2512125 RepID=UPI0010491AA4|nr:BatD family protein [Rhizobium sp. BK251]TCL74003.1 oxygen tolerance protein BatD [Rhizobium sp. BK251]